MGITCGREWPNLWPCTKSAGLSVDRGVKGAAMVVANETSRVGEDRLAEAGLFSKDPARRLFARLLCLVVAGIGWAGLAILGAAMLAKKPPEGGFDLQLLLDAAKRVAAGGSPYDLSTVTNGLSARDLFYSYPPLVAQVLAPFSGLPTWLMLGGWWLGSMVALALVAARVGRPSAGRRLAAHAATSLDVALLTLAAAPFFFPLTAALLFGNVDMWFPFLFGVLTLALISDRASPSRVVSVAGGASLAIATAVKLNPGVLLLWLVARKPAAWPSRWFGAMVIGATIATGAAILSVSLMDGGVGPWRDYLGYLRAAGNADLTSAVNIGPAAQVALVLGRPEIAGPLAVLVATAAVAATIASARLIADPLASLCLAVTASFVVLPVTWYHYPTALIPIAVAAWARSRGAPTGRSVTAALVAAYFVADAAIVFPVALWIAVALVGAAVRWSRATGSDAAVNRQLEPVVVSSEASTMVSESR